MFRLFFDNIYGRSPKWRDVRNTHVKNNPACAACGRKDGLEVHHIVPYNVDPSLELNPNNLITLCDKQCHFLFGHLCDWKSWNSDVVSDCLVYRNKINNRPYPMRPQNFSNIGANNHETHNGSCLDSLWKFLSSWYNRS